MLGFKSFRAATCVMTGIELMHMIRKGQMAMRVGKARSFADQITRWQDKSVLNKDGDTSVGQNSPFRDRTSKTAACASRSLVPAMSVLS